MKESISVNTVIWSIAILLALSLFAMEIIGDQKMERMFDNEAQAFHDFCQSKGHAYYFDTGGYIDRNNAKSTISVTCVDEDGTSHFYDFGPVDLGGMTITSSKIG